MVTKAEALTADEFHAEPCTRKVGPRGGITESIERWRRSGRTQTWKTRPDEFRVPIKYGLYKSHEITEHNAGAFHTADACPLNGERGQSTLGAILTALALALLVTTAMLSPAIFYEAVRSVMP